MNDCMVLFLFIWNYEITTITNMGCGDELVDTRDVTYPTANGRWVSCFTEDCVGTEVSTACIFSTSFEGLPSPNISKPTSRKFFPAFSSRESSAPQFGHIQLRSRSCNALFLCPHTLQIFELANHLSTWITWVPFSSAFCFNLETKPA